MSYVVATMKKLKAPDLGGIQVELDRQYKDENAYKNEVDLTRSNQNLELVQSHTTEKGSLRRDVESYINENKSSTRKIRKDAVVLNSWIITSDKSFFEPLTHEQQVQFFKDAKEFFANRYGEQNVRHATIHFDETTPHMHMGIVPLKDGKLSSKTLITPVELQKLQSECPAYMQQRGWNVERGIQGSERKHLDAPEYREATNKAKTLREQNTALETQTKNDAIDIIREINPGLKVSQSLFDRKRTEAEKQENGLMGFLNRFGFQPAPIESEQGRNQFFDWFSVERLKEEAFSLLGKLKDKVLNYRDENRRLREEISGQKQELTDVKQAVGKIKTDTKTSANDFFSSFIKSIDNEQKQLQQDKAEKAFIERQKREERNTGFNQGGGRSR